MHLPQKPSHLSPFAWFTLSIPISGIGYAHVFDHWDLKLYATHSNRVCPTLQVSHKCRHPHPHPSEAMKNTWLLDFPGKLLTLKGC